ncbi:ABC transporter permease [Microbacterium sp. W1N]|uniref:ABC transporter permease n=1 Tax=Microbacterium festucae TaxID=2977531 RepID=UPI0021BE6AB9|nr:ABC transporter permease [Microbacterium festucae]MCT9818756.1 ABC transporter permease [Microbacterium festucae]
MLEDAQTRFERLSRAPLSPITAGSGFWASIAEVLSHRQLLTLLVRRDIKARYKDSVLGLLWVLINPIVQLTVYYVVMGQFLGAARGIPEFAIYIFSGLTIYAFFSEMLSGSTGSIVANSGLVKKVYVPREIFPLASIGSAMFTFLVQLVVLIVACFLLGSPPLTAGLLYFFPSVALIIVYGMATGLLLSALNVYLRDVQYLTQVVLMLAMWASPIVYSWTMVNSVFQQFNFPAWLLEVYTNSPLTLAVLGFHRAFWVAGTPADYPPGLALRMAIAFAVGLVLLWICQRVFTRLQGNFAQEL